MTADVAAAGLPWIEEVGESFKLRPFGEFHRRELPELIERGTGTSWLPIYAARRRSRSTSRTAQPSHCPPWRNDALDTGAHF